MATVNGFTAERMLDIEGSTIVAGFVDVNGNLLLEKRNGDVVNAGMVKGDNAVITGAASTIDTENLTASRVLVSDTNGKVAASSTITTTELGYLDGVTSGIQSQIDTKLEGDVITAATLGTAAPSTYPVGVSVMNVGTDSTWPANLLTVLTTRYSASRTSQIATRKVTGQSWIRSETDPDLWGPWFEFASPGGDRVFGVGSAKVIPSSAGGGTVSSDGTVSFTNVTSVDVNDCFPPEYNEFEIFIFAESTSQIGWLLNLRSAGVVQNTALYEHAVVSNSAAATANAATTAADTRWIVDGGASGNYMQGSLIVRDVNKPSSSWMHGNFYTRRTTGTLSSVANRGGLHRGGVVCEGFRLSSTAAFSGEIKVYARR